VYLADYPVYLLNNKNGIHSCKIDQTNLGLGPPAVQLLLCPVVINASYPSLSMSRQRAVLVLPLVFFFLCCRTWTFYKISFKVFLVFLRP